MFYTKDHDQSEHVVFIIAFYRIDINVVRTESTV